MTVLFRYDDDSKLEEDLAFFNYPAMPEREDRLARLAHVLLDVTNGRHDRPFSHEVRRLSALIWTSLMGGEESDKFVNIQKNKLSRLANGVARLSDEVGNPDAAKIARLILTTLK